ncbi:hypothetical protein KC19_VG197900 [Ceratodon purpureus]|uniref:Uncharacterized protein n=1 Tax=Ceratodon purpureus TaxID=3225 RepID=A0A8T0HSB8_CERPU|nr:hypothetical protein KC19_VG197900 [Ceratodon purpureus]
MTSEALDSEQQRIESSSINEQLHASLSVKELREEGSTPTDLALEPLGVTASKSISATSSNANSAMASETQVPSPPVPARYSSQCITLVVKMVAELERDSSTEVSSTSSVMSMGYTAQLPRRVRGVFKVDK